MQTGLIRAHHDRHSPWPTHAEMRALLLRILMRWLAFLLMIQQTPPRVFRNDSRVVFCVRGGKPDRIGAHAVSQDREREAVHTALLCTARPQMVRARLQHVLADTGALVRDGACSITPAAGEAPAGGRSGSRGPPARRRSDEPRGGGDPDKAAGQPARQQPKSTTSRRRHPRKRVSGAAGCTAVPRTRLIPWLG